MKLSSKTHYGLMACHVLAKNYNDIPVSATTLENCISVSGKYLEKILRQLSSRDIVKATRGAQGGYYLSRPPKEVSVGEIVRALEDDMIIIDCVNKQGKCKCCPTSAVWKKLYLEINAVLDGITLQNVLDGEIEKC